MKHVGPEFEAILQCRVANRNFWNDRILSIIAALRHIRYYRKISTTNGFPEVHAAIEASKLAELKEAWDNRRNYRFLETKGETK